MFNWQKLHGRTERKDSQFYVDCICSIVCDVSRLVLFIEAATISEANLV